MKHKTDRMGVVDTSPSLLDLEVREQRLDGAEMELALQGAVLRGREATLAAGRGGLERRAQWIDTQVARLSAWSQAQGVDAADILHGLGDGAALQEADVEGHVKRSHTLLLGRAAILAAREEMLTRRQRQLDRRDSEIADLEQAQIRADVRLAARERMLLAAARELERRVAAPQPQVQAPADASAAARSPLLAAQAEAGADDPQRRLDWKTRPVPPPLAVDPSEIRGPDGRRRPSGVRFLAGLSLAGQPILPECVEVDGGTLLLACDTKVALDEPLELVYRSLEGRQQRWPVQVRMAMPAAEGAAAALVLSTEQWSEPQLQEFQRALESLRT